MTRRLAPAALRALREKGGELAVVDVREEATFGHSHLFWASCIPLTRLELAFAALVPRRGAPVVLCDAGGGEAERAAERLAGFGYTDVSVLEGGTDGWKTAGLSLYSGVNVPSKAFGEFVEHRYGTPSVTPEELQKLRSGPTPPVIVDSRPIGEYRRMNIPDGIDCPGAELVYRVPDLAPEAERLVVVNCAGRTRSIIGAQSLINAGLPNRIVALRNGTMGWELAGFQLEHGQERRAPDPSPEGLQRAREAAQHVARRFGVKTIDPATLARWRGEAAQRTLYVLDVRHPEEFAAGHLPGSRSAPGGQLVQATDEYIAVRGARVVLVDDTGVRATMTASWLVQMGWDAVVLERGLIGDLERGPAQTELLGTPGDVAEMEVEVLRRALADGTVALADLSSSRNYRRGHIPGAWFLMRGHLARDLANVTGGATLVLTSEDGRLARVATAEAAAARPGGVRVLTGGNAAWRALGLPQETGETRMASPAEDVYLKPYERGEGTEAAMRDYLTWEVALMEQIERDGEAQFRFFPAA